MVHFVGVGNGSADLMTVRGTKLMKLGDIIIYPYSKMEKSLIRKFG